MSPAPRRALRPDSPFVACLALFLLLAPPALLWPQENAEPPGSEEESDPFADPFATPDESGGADSAEVDGGDPFASDDFDSLFQDDEMIETVDESQMAENPQDDLLEQEGVRWGGSIRGSIGADWSYDDVWTSDFNVFEPTSNSLTPSLGADLFFDARPDPEFRAYGNLDLALTSDGGIDGIAITADTFDTGLLPAGWTAEEEPNGDIVIRDENGVEQFRIAGDTVAPADGSEPSTGTAPGLEISVFELFADYTWRDSLFFRYGKHTIKWGTGYFFSPADVLNLTAVDAEDPTADREGPLSLRVLYPFGLTGNAYLYAITNTGAGVLDVAVAPKVELAVGSGEIGIGAYYQRALAPRLVLLGSASIGEVDVFGEAVGMWGSDRVFVRRAEDQSAALADPDDDFDIVLETYEVDDQPFFQATAGARYLKEWESGVNLILVGQYFFNGEGYTRADGLLPAASRLLLNPGENGSTSDNPPALAFDDLANWGRHYAGATVSLSGLLDDLSLTAFGLVNLTDFSGIASPSIAYRILDRFSLSLSGRFTFGGPDDEYTDPAALLTGGEPTPTFGLTLSVSMPGGSF